MVTLCEAKFGGVLFGVFNYEGKKKEKQNKELQFSKKKS
jgi:hypothetical protein